MDEDGDDDDDDDVTAMDLTLAELKGDQTVKSIAKLAESEQVSHHHCFSLYHFVNAYHIAPACP